VKDAPFDAKAAQLRLDRANDKRPKGYSPSRFGDLGRSHEEERLAIIGARAARGREAAGGSSELKAWEKKAADIRSEREAKLAALKDRAGLKNMATANALRRKMKKAK
jgi:hypothetical protein